MSVRTEWTTVVHSGIELVKPREYTDANGSTNGQWAVLMGSNEVWVLEGSLPELRSFFQEGLAQVAEALLERNHAAFKHES